MELPSHCVGLPWMKICLIDSDAAEDEDGDDDHDADDDDDELTRSSLSIGKAGGHTSLKYRLDKRPADDHLDYHHYLD